MCGIAGIAYRGDRPVDVAEIRRMCDVMRYRGPDDEGIHVDGRMGIGMRRLSIIDVASGHQPIHNEDKTVWVVLNGEIYNYRELRDDLERRGHRFYTNSDTETLVHLYEEHGEDLVEHLNGMFCFAILDLSRKLLLLGRDRIGEKQLFYAARGDKFVFGSEIKCLFQTDAVTKDVDVSALDAYFTYLYVPAPATIFRDIRELPPAHVLVFDRDGVRTRRYWSLEFKVDRAHDPRYFVDAFRHRFREAVRLRLVSDVPLGALLSGGVDSSIVVAAMSEFSRGAVKTFTIGYDGSGAYYDERKHARIVADRFGTEHHEFVVRPDVADVIPKLVSAFDQPFADSSAIVNYYVFRETRKHVTVVLSGLGGDEIAAGYERHLGIRLQRLYQMFPRALREQLVERLVNMLPESKKGGRLVERAKRFVRTGAMPPDAAYLRYVSTFDEEGRRSLYSDRLREVVDLEETRKPFDIAFAAAGAEGVLNQALHADIMMYLPGDLLTLTDRMSMQHSVEARAPFIDHTLVEFMATVPPELKLRGFDKKHLLKRAFADRLPRQILHRRKQGFTVPLTVWFRNELNPLIRDVLSRDRIERTGLFRWTVVERMLDDHMNLRENHHGRIWALLMFMVWHDLYKPNGAQ